MHAAVAGGYRDRMLELLNPIATDRMTLRPYETADLAGLHDLYGREDVCRYLPWAPMDIVQAGAKLEQRMGQRRIEGDGDALVMAAVEMESGRMIGEFMLRLRNADHRQADIGWTIHPDVQGRGLATEGATELLRLGFEDLGAHRIMAGADPRNVASIRVMERLGMRREGVFLQSELVKGEWADDLVSAILESEWRSRRSAEPAPSG